MAVKRSAGEVGATYNHFKDYENPALRAQIIDEPGYRISGQYLFVALPDINRMGENQDVYMLRKNGDGTPNFDENTGPMGGAMDPVYTHKGGDMTSVKENFVKEYLEPNYKERPEEDIFAKRLQAIKANEKETSPRSGEKVSVPSNDER
ncbi:MAG: hypothetical protein J6I68_02345 [Butyrivibrio sp.]|uniref:hypothetical protein n=1 Tax=Butyrivibrio sp. TaxID=28121 RepID=UPI001B4D38FA|nr:hypothetical protein [Butyrivibrio sp.]MBP3782064.1 hypothetical protein [Butyrivibrio sp.]